MMRDRNLASAAIPSLKIPQPPFTTRFRFHLSGGFGAAFSFAGTGPGDMRSMRSQIPSTDDPLRPSPRTSPGRSWKAPPQISMYAIVFPGMRSGIFGRFQVLRFFPAGGFLRRRGFDLAGHSL